MCFFNLQRARKENAKIKEQMERQRIAKEREVSGIYTVEQRACDLLFVVPH